MNSLDYIKDAIRTESREFEAMDERLADDGMKRLLHAGIGLSTESGEFIDALKKHIFYGKELDRVNLTEEIGDLFWYLAIASDELNIDFESVMSKNIEKLNARYGEKFTADKAENRDLNNERTILEDQQFTKKDNN
jgi:NTP pyrophosphatase (non-canonical NTP hydrolase)